MERKEISHFAVNLIEEALEKPDQTIVLEERITKSICEPGIKEPTKEELSLLKGKIMWLVYEISGSYVYKEHLEVSPQDRPISYLFKINYNNGSKIILRREK